MPQESAMRGHERRGETVLGFRYRLLMVIELNGCRTAALLRGHAYSSKAAV
jgi:hypothetical protein